ncbi:protein phosphatase regulatory subunit [Niveomyces insectorum RCEF 264]|uniref:Protein phosphatase regulatory subunit n=1 Tax=Niveomyces insectorum RCEF 264 TaxID=1081102 RepID=A0A167P2I9_9HYPO|nr:protein phosphatase regulatory subunit [Niveomyces insectorum RCEF 264]
MPYTPPSHRSPPSSAASSPKASRRSSFNAAPSARAPSPRAAAATPPALPRSSSYLTRHRRTPSAVSTSSAPGQPTPRATSEDLQGLVASSYPHDDDCTTNSVVRQSPPPVTGDRRGMPSGAVISPPDSPPSSDDEARAQTTARGRQIDNMTELQRLHDAISLLPQQRRESSPSDPARPRVLVASPTLAPSASIDGMRHSYSTTSLDDIARASNYLSGRRSPGVGVADVGNYSHHIRRRTSHVRSATEPNLPATPSNGSSSTASDEENDLAILQKPQMVRKKSGELVRPALRLGSHRRPSSMPGTPTFSKAVHFDSHLEHVRHFLQVDRPLAVSAGSSPVENYDSETEYPFNGNGGQPDQHNRTASHPWEIIVSKFPVDTPDRKEQPVRLERVWLSADQKFLHGSIAVLNLAFSKSVVCRFTLDYWKTTSEVAAEYSAEVVPRVAPQGHDRFIFSIKLSDLANLESKTMYFCIRYNVGGQEFWDNNNGNNFQLDFKKKKPAVNDKTGGIGGGASSNGGALPRSNRRPHPPTAPRPVSLPVSLDDLFDSSKAVLDPSVYDYFDESGPTLRLKSSQSALNLPSDNLAGRLSSPSGQAFANRYDFSASLSAAMQAAKDAMTTPTKRDGLYMKSSRKLSGGLPALVATAAANAAAASSDDSKKLPVADSNTDGATAVTTPTTTPSTTLPSTTHDKPVPVARADAVLDRDSRAILAESGFASGPGSIASKSYDEIVSKYCFYVPNQTNQNSKDGVLRGALQHGQVDGAAKDQPSPASTVTSDGSPVQLGHYYQHLSHPHQWHRRHTRGQSDTTSPPTSQSQHPVQHQATSAAHSTASSGGTRSASPASPSSPASPASLVGAFAPFAATPPSEYPYQSLKDRFPFMNADAHSATAIRG